MHINRKVPKREPSNLQNDTREPLRNRYTRVRRASWSLSTRSKNHEETKVRSKDAKG